MCFFTVNAHLLEFRHWRSPRNTKAAPSFTNRDIHNARVDCSQLNVCAYGISSNQNQLSTQKSTGFRHKISSVEDRNGENCLHEVKDFLWSGPWLRIIFPWTDHGLQILNFSNMKSDSSVHQIEHVTWTSQFQKFNFAHLISVFV